jgi:hypothetical protein
MFGTALEARRDRLQAGRHPPHKFILFAHVLARLVAEDRTKPPEPPTIGSN